MAITSVSCLSCAAVWEGETPLDQRRGYQPTKNSLHAISVHDTALNITVVPSMFPFIPALLEKHVTGIYNFVNEGQVTIDSA